MYRAMYFEALYILQWHVLNTEDQFDLPGFFLYRRLQNVFEKSVQGKNCEEDLTFIADPEF